MRKQTLTHSLIAVLCAIIVSLAACGKPTATVTPTPVPSRTASPSRTLTAAPSATPTHTSTPVPMPTHTATPVPAPVLPTVTPTCTISPQKMLGILPSTPSTDSVIYARQDGAVVLHTLVDAQERVLLESGTYDVTGDNFLIAIGFPTRLSPNGQWLLVPTPERGTWLVSMDGQTRRQFSGQKSFTWAPDSRRIVFQVEGAIYVQDVVTGTEPELIAQIPGDKLFYPTWSPGGDSAEFVAAFSCEDSVCTAWLIDVSTRYVRELGQFVALPMMAVPDMIGWTADGAAVLIQTRQGTLAFPIQGGGPRPLASAWQNRRGTLSPGGVLEAWTEITSDSDFPSRLMVARAGTEQQVTYNLAFEQIEKLNWTNDGQRLLIQDYVGWQRLWAVDPAIGEPTLIANHILLLGTPDQLRQLSTEVSTLVVPLPRTSDPSNWPAYGVPGWSACLHLPPAWRVESRSNSRTGEIWQITAANFEFAEQEGIAALTEDHIEVSFVYNKRPSNGQELPLDRVKEMERRYAAVESSTLGGYPAIRIRPLVSPVSEELRVQLDGGQLWITYKPLSSTHQAVLDQILKHIDFDLDRPCSTPSGLVVEAYALKGPPQVEPLNFVPVQGSAQEILQKRQAEREKRVSRIWKTSSEMSVAFGEGQLTATLTYTDTNEGQFLAVQVTYDGDTIYTVPLGPASPFDSLQELWVHDGHWYLEVADWQGRGQVIRDGESLNERDGCEETFGFQLLHGRPFWFYQREGWIGVSFDGQETLLGYDHVPHNQCCSGAEANPIRAENIVAFFARRDGTWYYVELGVHRTLKTPY